jgi:hypothetical protein
MLRLTVSRPVYLCVKPPSRAQDYIFASQTVAGLLMWGALSDERTGLSFTIAAGLMTIFYCLRVETLPTWRARSPYLYPPGTGWPSYISRHWVLFSSPPTTRRATVGAFEPACTQRLKLRVTLRLLDYRQSVRLGAKPLRITTRDFFRLNSCGHNPYMISSLTRR